MRKTEQPNVKLHPFEVFVQILKTADSIPLFPEDKTQRLFFVSIKAVSMGRVGERL